MCKSEVWPMMGACPARASDPRLLVFGRGVGALFLSAADGTGQQSRAAELASVGGFRSSGPPP
eukprot:6798297-Alexandrium_andersonii.AAC.1